jgi:hypothetical protein
VRTLYGFAVYRLDAKKPQRLTYDEVNKTRLADELRARNGSVRSARLAGLRQRARWRSGRLTMRVCEQSFPVAGEADPRRIAACSSSRSALAVSSSRALHCLRLDHSARSKDFFTDSSHVMNLGFWWRALGGGRGDPLGGRDG